MGLIKWMGRVMLWLVFWPVGLWRSIHHGRKKAIEQAVRQATASTSSGAVTTQAQVALPGVEYVAGHPLPPAP